jgi:hypothetical protein
LPCEAPLAWVDLGADDLHRDGHMRVVAWRAANTLGLLA